jgi:hypothetical protein
MKTYTTLAALFFLVLTSCMVDGDGPQGPRGPAGQDGLDGEEAYVFEYENVNFVAPDYNAFVEFPSTFQMLNSDMVLVYFLWDVTDAGDDVWRIAPQLMVTDYGLLQYNFDFTKFDVQLFLDGDFNLDLLGASYTDNWVVRVVVVPGQFENRTNIDFSDYNAVKEAYGLKDLPAPASAAKRF